MKILQSASKIVFLFMALCAGVGFFTGHLKEDNMMILISMAFSFYFANKGSPDDNFLGK